MKVLVTTASRPDTLPSYYVHYLSRIPEINVEPAYTFDIERKYEFTGVRGRLHANVFPGLIGNKVTTHLLDRVDETKPELILIFKGMFIKPGTLKELRQRGIKLVNYNPDHPIHFDSPGSGNRYVRNALKYYDLIYTYSPIIKNLIENKYPLAQVKVLPFGFIPSQFNSTSLKDLPRINRVCFIGIGDKYRRDIIHKISKAGFPIDVYGSGYQLSYKKLNGRIKNCPAMFGDPYNAALQSYDVQLNLFRRQNRNAHNMRTFEIPAVGGIQLCEYSEQCQTFFEPDKEIFMYKSFQDLKLKLEKLLSMSRQESIDYKEKARLRCHTNDYSYRNRAQTMVADFKQLLLQ